MSAARPARPDEKFERADAGHVRQTIRRILEDPDFQVRQGPWTRFLAWLRWKLSGWKGPAFALGRWGGVVFWVVIVWCVLTLIAIAAHLVWTVVAALPRRDRSAPRRDTWGVLAARDQPVETLEREMAAAARRGDYRRAIALMSLALLRRLDSAGALSFHKAKTGGEYVHEYAPDRAGRDAFARFVRHFDAAAYAGQPCQGETYQALHSISREVIDRALSR